MEKITLPRFFALLSSKIESCFLPKNKISTLGLQMPNIFFFSPQSQDMTQNNISKSGYGGFFLSFKNLVALFLICFLGLSTQIYGQFAPVLTPKGGFAIDGDLRANTPTADQGDWFPGAATGTGESVFDASGEPSPPATDETSGRVDTEEPFGSNDDIFTSGSKFNGYVSDLKWSTNSAPDKNDIDNALYHVARDASDNQWIFISGDRQSTNGTSYIDFELLQGNIVQNDDGTFTGIPLTSKANGGGRTKDDIIISMEYSNGGTKPNVFIYQWKESVIKNKTVWSYVQVPSDAGLLANAFAETNRGGAELGVLYSAFGTNMYQQYAFVEAAVNVTYLLNQSGASCSGLKIKTLWVKTKASDVTDAALKDFITPIPVDFNFGSTEITEIGPFCADNTGGYPLSAKPSGGAFSGLGVAENPSNSGSYYFTPSSAGAGTHEISYTSADLSCTGSIFIDVIANPVVYTLSGNSICASAQNTGVITLNNSQTGFGYQLKKTSDNSSVASSQDGTTGSSLTWTGLPAEVSYYVLATGGTPTNCTSQTGNASITEVANPVVYTLSGNSICASDPNTGVITLSNSQTGVSYLLKKTSDDSIVPSSQKSGTDGSSLSWTGLPSGVSYYVLATGGTPTNCTSQTGNASVTEVANPVVYTLSGNSICASDPNTGVITLSNSQTDVSYLLKKTSDDSIVPSSQKSGTDGFLLSWTGLPSGVSYYVLATGGTPTNCTSQTGNASVTEVANPAVYTLSGNSICASDPNTGVITLSNSQTGVSYLLKKTSDDSIVPSSQKSGTDGSSLSWTGLPSGVSYYVLATGGTPTNCISQTGNASVTEVANPLSPSVTYNPPACDEIYFSITVTNLTEGAIYTVTDGNGGGISGSPYTAGSESEHEFGGFAAGSGYKVTVSVSGCVSLPEVCPVPSEKLISAKKEEITTPIAAKTVSSGFDAYPVPFKDQLTIRYKYDYVSDVKIEVFNAQGVSVLSKKDANAYLNKEITLDLHANKGKEQVYIVKLTTDRETSTKKVLSSK